MKNPLNFLLLKKYKTPKSSFKLPKPFSFPYQSETTSLSLKMTDFTIRPNCKTTRKRRKYSI
jgi:hypothetical protein